MKCSSVKMRPSENPLGMFFNDLRCSPSLSTVRQIGSRLALAPTDETSGMLSALDFVCYRATAPHRHRATGVSRPLTYNGMRDVPLRAVVYTVRNLFLTFCDPREVL